MYFILMTYAKSGRVFAFRQPGDPLDPAKEGMDGDGFSRSYPGQRDRDDAQLLVT